MRVLRSKTRLLEIGGRSLLVEPLRPDNAKQFWNTQRNLPFMIFQRANLLKSSRVSINRSVFAASAFCFEWSKGPANSTPDLVLEKPIEKSPFKVIFLWSTHILSFFLFRLFAFLFGSGPIHNLLPPVVGILQISSLGYLRSSRRFISSSRMYVARRPVAIAFRPVVTS